MKAPRTYPQLRAQAHKLLAWWRDRLGLRDWGIDIEYVDNLIPLAECRPMFTTRRARIGLSTDMIRWKSNDLEETIVHELLHIHFGACGVGLSEKSYDPQKLSKAVLTEQAINAIASALVSLKRQRRT